MRGDTTVTIADEVGKGAEVLRQQVVDFTSNGSYVVLLAEVDTIVRNVQIVAGANVTKGTIQVQRRLGDDIVNMSDEVDISVVKPYVSLDVPLNDVGIGVGESLIIHMNGKSPGTTRLSAHVGWMPDIHGLNSIYQSF